MTNLEIVNQLVANGYQLVIHSAEEMADIFTNAELMKFLNCYMDFKRG